MTPTTPTPALAELDLDKLEALAQMAAPGPWMRLFGERTVYDRMSDGCRGTTIVRADTSFSSVDAANLDFIAAANPAAVLHLIALARRAAQPVAPVQAWVPVTKQGQVRVGDKLRFTIGDKSYNQRAKLILHAGMEDEEVIYDKGRNFYFITKCVLSGFSNHKNVEVLQTVATPSPQIAEVAELPELSKFSQEDLEAVADGLDTYEKTVNVGGDTGMGDYLMESTTAYAARFIRAYIAAQPGEGAGRAKSGIPKRAWSKEAEMMESWAKVSAGQAAPASMQYECNKRHENGALLGWEPLSHVETDKEADEAMGNGYLGLWRRVGDTEPRTIAAQPAARAGQAGQVAVAAVLEEICDMQAKNYGDGMGTHLALIDLCDRARKILAAERAAAAADQPSAQVKP